PAGGMEHASFTLAAEEPSAQDASDQPGKQTKSRNTQAASRQKTGGDEAQILSYRHSDKRVNNPEVGMVHPRTDPDAGKTRWAYDPHLDPVLQFDPQRSRIEKLIDDALASGDTEQMKAALEELKRLQSPYLNWAGKAERTSFEVDTVSLHVHERIDPASILSAVRKAMKGEGRSKGMDKALQPGLFDAPFENLPLRDAIDFYRHEKGWANRLIAGDSLLVMNSLLQKESMAGKVQMIYIDPPYGIKYGSNFQPFVNKRDVKDGKDEDLTAEPETIKAFRDTWELGIHSYLTYLRDRLLLAKELLHESGSCFVQISDENVHHVREIMDEVFDINNFIAMITFRKKTMPLGAKTLEGMSDYLLLYAKNKEQIKYHQLFLALNFEGDNIWKFVELPDGSRRTLQSSEINNHKILPIGSRVYRLVSMSPPTFNHEAVYDYKFNGKIYRPSGKGCWLTTKDKMDILAKANRLQEVGNTLNYILFADDFAYKKITNLWETTTGPSVRNYRVETAQSVVQRCMLMTTDPGDLVFDPTCGRGTTAYVAEQWGRRWITCDTSRVAITIAKQRLMTALFDYYDLAHPDEGVGSGFKYETVPHITLKSIANNEPPATETLYDKPFIDRSKHRVTGPFTVEAVPSLAVRSV